MKKFCFPLLLVLAAPLAARGETIYAAWIDPGAGFGQLTRFDSDSPWQQEEAFPLSPQLPLLSLEFDPETHGLWGFDYVECWVLCPPPLDPSIIDPFSGASSFMHLPGLQLTLLVEMDTDIDPLTRELRYFNQNGENFSYSLDHFEVRSDEPLSLGFEVAAVAHKLPEKGSGGVETYVIGRPTGSGPPGTPRGSRTGAWYQLARIGGPNGNPPASSGEVTLIGPVDVESERMGFDISSNGTAYLGTFYSLRPPGTESRLHTVNLESGAVHEVGVITPPSPEATMTGITVAPQGLGAGIVEVPALSPAGIVLLVLFLAGVALRRFRLAGSR